MKVIVLKPVTWNRIGYVRPEGIEKAGTDFVALHGFGAEEWNGDENRIWNGMKVFYTNTTEKLCEYGKNGELGIIMTAYNDGVPYAVGVATSVKLNSRHDIEEIAKKLNGDGQAKEIWGLQSVKNRHKSWARFKQHWESEWRFALPWRCPPSQFCWFENPIPIDPAQIFPQTQKGRKSPDVIKMYGRFQAILPDQALAIVTPHLPGNSPIVKWLSAGKFDQSPVAKKTREFNKPRKRKSGRQTSGSATEDYVRYVETYERRISPKHTKLQKQFRKFIESRNATSINENNTCVDIQFRTKEFGYVLGETKPCGWENARFAIRTAIGQLLDYRQLHPGGAVRLLIIVGCRPQAEDVDLALSNGFGIAYPRRKVFEIEFPSGVRGKR